MEAGGPFHDPERGAVRDAWLEAKGFRVLRFSNQEIRSAPDVVADRILAAVTSSARFPEFEMLKMHCPSPPVGEGGLRSRSDVGSLRTLGFTR